MSKPHHERGRLYRACFEQGAFGRREWKGWFVIAVWLTVFVLGIVGIIGLCYKVDSTSCAQKGTELSGVTASHYRFVSGCYLTLRDGRTISDSDYDSVLRRRADIRLKK